MVMKKYLYIVITILAVNLSTAQYVIKDGSELGSLQRVPLEKMYAHISSPLLFTGEYLYYKIYCINAQSNRLSNISRLAYVQLVNSKGEIIASDKLNLVRGMGRGDLFIGTAVPSGNYKLVAFTQWMKNGGLEQIYKQDIAIVNPYMADQAALLNSNDNIIPNSKTQGDDDPDEAAELLFLETDKSSYGTRSVVNLTLQNFKGSLGYGEYSLVVRRKSEITVEPAVTAETFANNYLNVPKILPQNIGDTIYLPEQRGELIFGEVRHADHGLPGQGVEVILSIPGENFVLKSSTTDAYGKFFAYLQEDYRISTVIVQAMGDEPFDISLLQKKELPYRNLPSGSFAISSTDKEAILERSVRNQIENAYFGLKPDSLMPADLSDPFFGGIPETFKLDDYTRFATLEETMVEILNTVGYRRGSDGGEYIRVMQDFERIDEPFNDFPALVLIDGVLIPNHGEIKSFNAVQIEEIKVLRDVVTLGAKQYQGIVAIKTFDGDYFETYKRANQYSGELELREVRKNYYVQDYSSELYNRVPDYREVLLWMPEIKMDSGKMEYEFFTSDTPGTYEVILEGFTNYGKPVSVKKEFLVSAESD